ncbi:MAG: pyridoxamine 5'-phosphate oxidase [Lapillicoccus sp.]
MSTGDRVDYDGDGLAEAALARTPWQQVRLWVDEATRRQSRSGDVPEPAALSVATVDAAGAQNVRTVLMRFLDERGPGFATNLESAKAVELQGEPRVAASLTWPSMYRSVRFRGRAEEISREEVAAYFGSRPWGSRISAWASQQSRPASGRAQLEDAYARYAARWPDRGGSSDVPLPGFWGGYRIRCNEVEIWAGRRNRLHDRLVFTVVPGSVNPGLDDAVAWRVTRRQP